MCEAESAEGRGIVYDCSLIFGAEACGEGVSGLGAGSMDTVNMWGNSGWWGWWRGRDRWGAKGLHDCQ